MEPREKPVNNQHDNAHHVCGYVAIVGMPNVGKSTLMNRYLHEKVSIVTPKPQTTRANVTTILSAENYQVIFIDTPGLLTPRYRMQEVMASLIKHAIAESDVILLIIDAEKYRSHLSPAIVKLADEMRSKKVIVALNKIDSIKKVKLLKMIKETSDVFPDAEIFPISALKGDGTYELLGAILQRLPTGGKLYPDDIISTEPERFFAAEIIREAVFLSMEEEIPYATAVLIEGFEEKKPKCVIHAAIVVEKNSHKPIIIGKKGRTIKEIGTKARFGIEEFLGCGVYLDLHVKVRKDWRNKESMLREIGLRRK